MAYPALPPRGGMIRRSPSEIARRIYGGGISQARRASSAVQRGYGRAAATHARVASTDTLGGVLAQALGPSTAMFTLGAADESEMGRRFASWTGGLIKPSVALAILGGVARGFSLDRRFAPRFVTNANTAILKGTFISGAYAWGARAPGVYNERFGSDSPKASRGNLEGVEPKPIEYEPIPGEQTES